MATPVFEQEKSVFFAMDGSGIVSTGGCTQDWWDTEVASSGAAAAMAKLMDVDTGAPILSMSDVGYFASVNRLMATDIHVGVEIGMVLYAWKDGGAGTIVTGAYKITNVAIDMLTCSGINGTDCTVGVRVGGAFDELEDAIDETDASDFSVRIYVNSVAVGSNFITTGGNKSKNSFLRLTGFNTVPGDMNFGGAYYESPVECLQNDAIDNTKAVLLDRGTPQPVIIMSVDNVIMENFHLYGSESLSSIMFSGTPQNIVFRNCRFSLGNGVCNSAVDGVLFDSCYSHDNLTNHHYHLIGGHSIFIGCVAKRAATHSFVRPNGSSTNITNCIIVGGARGVQVGGGGKAFVSNNTFYNGTNCGVINAGGDDVYVINNIFMLAPGATGLLANTGGSVVYNDYNCFINTDGTPLTVGGHLSGYEAPVLGPHSIEADPLFVDAANGDFRLQPGSPCLNTGRQLLPNGYSNMGAWQALGGSRPQVRRK